MKEFFEKLEILSAAFDDPEYLFLVLEPLLVWGIAFGVVGLVVTYFLKNEKGQVASLIVIAVSALAVLPYLGARSSAETRIGKVYGISAPARAKEFQSNTSDRIEHRWIYLALAGVAGAAILVGPRRNRLGFGLAIGSVAFSIYAINFGLWMHYQDSLAYHPNLKRNEAPVKEKLRAEPAESSPVAEVSEQEDPVRERSSSSNRSNDSEDSSSGSRREIRPLTAGTGSP